VCVRERAQMTERKERECTRARGVFHAYHTKVCEFFLDMTRERERERKRERERERESEGARKREKKSSVKRERARVRE